MYHKKNVDYAYIRWEDFIYQVENKNVKRSNEMYYPRFTKVIVNFFMTKDQSIPRQNTVNWHYSKDDYMFTTIKVVSRHEDTQLYGAILPNELMNEDIRNSESYKEYYAIASGAEPPKMKASVKKKQVGSDKATTPPKGKRLKTLAKTAKPAKKKQPANTSMDKGLKVLSEVALTEAEQLKLVIERSKTQTHISHDSGSGTDEGTEFFNDDSDPFVSFFYLFCLIKSIILTPTYDFDDEQISWKSSKENNDDEVNVSKDDDTDNNDDDNDDDVDKDINDDDVDNQDKDDQDAKNPDDDNEQMDSDNNGDDFVHPKFSTHNEEEREEESFNPRVQTPSHIESTDDEDDDEEVQGMNIEGEEMDEGANNEESERNELYREDTHVIITPVIPEGQQQSSSVSSSFVSSMLNPRPDTDEAQAKNANFLNKLDDNIKKIIKDHVKEQVKAQVFKILPKIKKTVNEQLEAEVMTCSSTESKTSHAIAANLSELELKKILIEKMESNKSIHKSDEQKNLYKELVDAYESNKLILDTYGDTVSFKRRRDDEDKDEEPSARSNRGSKRRRAGKEPVLTSTPKEKTPKSTGKSTEGSKSIHKFAGESAHAEEPMHTAKDFEELAHQEFETGATEDQPVDETP
ncbi:hypothetical protein Tco_0276695 [Tanacetum coccineum]